MKTLLVIFAHPDDESHGSGGTLAKYAAEGVKVHYLCVTRGEAGIVDDRFMADGGDIAELRTRELQFHDASAYTVRHGPRSHDRRFLTPSHMSTLSPAAVSATR